MSKTMSFRILSAVLALMMVVTVLPAIVWQPAAGMTTGDVNSDSEIDLKDVLLLRKHIAGVSELENPALGDTNGDGEINLKDVLLLRKYIVGMDVTLATLATAVPTGTATGTGVVTEPTATGTETTVGSVETTTTTKDISDYVMTGSVLYEASELAIDVTTDNTVAAVESEEITNALKADYAKFGAINPALGEYYAITVTGDAWGPSGYAVAGFLATDGTDIGIDVWPTGGNYNGDTAKYYLGYNERTTTFYVDYANKLRDDTPIDFSETATLCFLTDYTGDNITASYIKIEVFRFLPPEHAATATTVTGATTRRTTQAVATDADGTPYIDFIDNSEASLGVWWWWVENDSTTDTYLDFMEKNQVTEIYYYAGLYSLETPTSRGVVHNFVQKAMAHGMRVALLWDDQDCASVDNTEFTKVVANYKTYLTEYPTDDFYGIHCDIEQVDYQEYVTNFIVAEVAPAVADGVCVELDLNSNYSSATYDYTGSVLHDYDGTSLGFYDIVANNVSTMCMMSYQTNASGMVNKNTPPLQAAVKANTKIIFGMETGISGEGSSVDFSQDSKKIVYEFMIRVDDLLKDKELPEAGYGYAIHHSRAWPALKDT